MVHYLLDIHPAGRKGRKVEVVLFNPELPGKGVVILEKEFRPVLITKEYSDEALHTSFGTPADGLLEHLAQEHPGIDFSFKQYSAAKRVVHARLPGWQDKDALPDQFFRTIERCHVPRTGYMPITDAQELLEQVRREHLDISFILSTRGKEDSLEGRIQVEYGTCAKKDLNGLPSSFMTRAARRNLKEEDVTTEEQAQNLKDELRQELRRAGITDVDISLTENEDQYFLKVYLSPDAVEKLPRNTARGLILLPGHDSRIRTPDPLQLGSPTKMLRRYFPQFMRVPDPSLPLEEWPQLLMHPFTKDELPAALDDLLRIPWCALDLEVENYDLNDRRPFRSRKRRAGTGQAYHAILSSPRERILFTTKDQDDLALQKRFPGRVIVRCENETDLIETASHYARNYVLICGHNIIDYDLGQHLTKHNKGRHKSWDPGFVMYIDTFHYLRNRISMRPSNGLESHANIKKTLNYAQMRELNEENTCEGNTLIATYTILDGEHTEALVARRMQTILLEGLATHNSHGRVTTQTQDNLYDFLRERQFFLRMKTFRERNDRSYLSRIERVQERARIDETLESLLRIPARPGIYMDVEAVYPSLMFDVFEELIRRNPVMDHVLATINEGDGDARLIKARMLAAFLKEPVHHAKKIWKKYFGREFGEAHAEPAAVYPCLRTRGAPSELEQTMSLYDWRWGQAFCNPDNSRHGYSATFPLSWNILHFNNLLAQAVKDFPAERVVGTAPYFFIGDNIPGIPLGKGNAIYLEPGRLLGRIDGRDVAIGIRIDNGLVKGIVNTTLSGERPRLSEYGRGMADLSPEDLTRYKDVLSLAFGTDVRHHVNGQDALPL